MLNLLEIEKDKIQLIRIGDLFYLKMPNEIKRKYLGELIRGEKKRFITYKKSKHFYRLGQGFELNRELLDILIKEEVNDIIIKYIQLRKQTKILYKISLIDFLRYSQPMINEEIEPQLVISKNRCELIK